MVILLIDSSYYNFYRFFATQSWYNRNTDRVEDAKDVDWLDNKIFMTTFEKMWFETIRKLQKQFKPDRLIFARDGKDVWRYKVYPEYKATRKAQTDDSGGPGPVFKHVNENYHQRLDAIVVYVDEAEADDIAAVATQYFDERIILITGDHDYLQLSEPGRVEIYQLKGNKCLTVDNPEEVVLYKILAGDPSDNIPPAWPKCGKVTAKKLAADPEKLEEMLSKKGRDQFELNRQLIDFRYLPENIVEKIIDELEKSA